MTERGGGPSVKTLATGVPGLDDVLGGGIPEFSFNLIVGGPGSGKTTLAHQIMFANATPERPGLYFTILGEPPLKMLRYQQLYSFFDAAKVNGVIRFVSLGDAVMQQGLPAVLDGIVRQVEAASPGLVIVDSFRSAMRVALSGAERGELAMQDFVQRLALHLTAWEATTFLIGEFTEPESQDHPVYTIADGLLALSQRVERNSIVRKLQVVKLRGQRELPGLHTFRITGDGLRVFPRLPKPEEEPAERNASQSPMTGRERLSTGIAGLDEMLHGGIPQGYSVLIAGPSGSGKTVLAGQFIAEGVRQGEPAVIAIFEKRPAGYLKTTSLGRDLEQMIRDGRLAVVYLRPLDLSVDETLYELRAAVRRTGATRVVIDSLSGFEMAVSPGFREDFRESLYRLVGVLTGLGVTVVMTLEIEDSYGELRLGPRENAFLADAIILQRYVEIQGQLQRIMTIVKVRASEHSKDLRLYEITSDGLVLDGRAPGYHGLLTGNPGVSAGQPSERGHASRPRKSRRNR
ncbi:MAG TPA: ATPase domain-containing protein [Methylomirabilota bacterium]|jgi:circadian clock protein KaiC|nr:ATPase domain-containing protein [Methylomirabilota bacterium]